MKSGKSPASRSGLGFARDPTKARQRKYPASKKTFVHVADGGGSSSTPSPEPISCEVINFA
jgi:hypothetical protein